MNRGEIWLINFDPTLGAEIKKTRPAIIVSSDTIGKLPLKVIVPVTDWKSTYSSVSWQVRLTPSSGNGLSKISAADTFQIRSVSHQRFIRKLGNLSSIDLAEITKALALVLRIR